MSIVEKLFGTHSEREIKRIMPLVEKIESLRDSMMALSDEDLRGKTKEYKKRLEEGETLDDLLPEAFASVREAAWRTLGQKHYPVQIQGGIIMHQGRIAEMRTGEGKTLAATLPSYLNALEGKGVHVVTVNDYLARRDAEWMGPMYQFHGLSVACIDNTRPNSEERRKAYMADITFGTNNEFGFDYLRDNMASAPKDLVQRKHHFAIVDEVDSVLIDDARTPLIISGPVPKGGDQLFAEYQPAAKYIYDLQSKMSSSDVAEAKRLFNEGNHEEAGKLLLRAHKAMPKYKALIKFLSEPGVKVLLQKTENFYMQDNEKRMHEITDDNFVVHDEKMNSLILTDKGHEVASKRFGEDGFFVLPDIGARIAEIEAAELSAEERAQQKDTLLADYAIKADRVHTMNQLLKAYFMFEKEVEYVLIEGKVKIVDEQTGRIMEGRRYSDGLHQAIEAKERVKVEAATQTFATITLQNYFRMYHKLAGMTGTAETEEQEFRQIYALDVVVIPTNKELLRKDENDVVYKNQRGKLNAVVKQIAECRTYVPKNGEVEQNNA